MKTLRHEAQDTRQKLNDAWLALLKTFDPSTICDDDQSVFSIADNLWLSICAAHTHNRI